MCYVYSAEVIRSGTIVNTLSNVIAMVEALQEKKDSLPVYTTESSLLRARRGVSKTARRGFESVEDDEEKKERERSADRTSVFFSFPGLFFVAYSGTTALSLHTIIAIIGFLYASSLSSTSALFSSLLTEVSALIAALLSGAMTGLILSFLAPMYELLYITCH